MKKKIIFSVVLFFFVLMVPLKVWAESLNEYELKFIEMLSYTYEFNGGYYKVPDEYLELVVERLSNNDPDWNEDKYNDYTKMFFSNFSTGIKEGVFVKIGSVKKKKPAANQGNTQNNNQNQSNQNNQNDNNQSDDDESYNDSFVVQDMSTADSGEEITATEEAINELVGAGDVANELVNLAGSIDNKGINHSQEADYSQTDDEYELDENTVIMHIGENGELIEDDADELVDQSENESISEDTEGTGKISEDGAGEMTDTTEEDKLQGDTEPKKLGNISNNIMSKFLVAVCAVVILGIVVVVIKKKSRKR